MVSRANHYGQTGLIKKVNQQISEACSAKDVQEISRQMRQEGVIDQFFNKNFEENRTTFVQQELKKKLTKSLDLPEI